MTKIKPLGEVLEDRTNAESIHDKVQIECYLNRHYPLHINPFPAPKVYPEPEPIDEDIDWLAMMTEPDPLLDFPPEDEDIDWDWEWGWMEPGDSHYYPKG